MYTKEEIYKVMFIFLHNLYEQEKYDSIGSLLGDMSVLNDDNITADPAVWEDWNDIIKVENISDMISTKQAVALIKKFLKYYNDNFGFDLESAISEFHKISNNIESLEQYINNILHTSKYDECFKFHLFQ